MSVLSVLLALAAGIFIGAGGVFVYQNIHRTPPLYDLSDSDIRRQYLNFLNYDGSERGQRALDREEFSE